MESSLQVIHFVYISVWSQVDYFVVGAAIFVLAFLMVAIGLRMSAYIDNMRKFDGYFLSLSVFIKDTRSVLAVLIRLSS